jgi:short-subunit dehydrogenase
MRYEGQVFWVTGASSGIGAALAAALGEAGAALILSGRNVAALDALAARIPGGALVLPFETTDIAALPGIVARAGAWRGRIDGLVNNAGISQRCLALDTGLEVYRRIMEVDFFAPLALTQLVLPGMVASGAGHVVAVSSVAGKLATPLRTAYCAAKHALVGYCDALRAEMEEAYGVRVTTVLPGSVRTQIAVNALRADGSARGVSDANIDNGLDPAEVARRILSGMAAGLAEIVIAEGQEAAAVELRRHAPATLFALIAKEGARLAHAREAAGASFTPDAVRLAGDDQP